MMRILVLSFLFAGAVAAAPQDDSEEAPGPGVQSSSSCERCHSNASTASGMRDASGRDIAPFDLWQGTMMANSARDPLWRAAVAAEVAATPSRRPEIEAKCLRCHAPMAEQIGLESHETDSLMHVLDCESELGELARDGVSCTICHGITPDNLGSEASFTGHYQLDPWNRLFGPHADPFAMPMQNMAGFTPTRGDHIKSSALCATCHTLETDALLPDGSPTGARLLEQGPYLEWRNSAFSTESSPPGSRASDCQACHVPTTDVDGQPIRTIIARNPGGRDFPPTAPRSPFGRHVFVGGNTLIPAILRDHAAELDVAAPAAAFDATIAAARAQLERATASVSLHDVRQGAGQLEFDVRIVNLAGHKFPTGHPTRRAWLAAVVRNAAGDVVFASGMVDEAGRIVGQDGKPLASEFAGGPIEPHRDRVESSSHVARFEAVMADSTGAPTHTLLRGTTWLKDDRLLPAGWSAEAPDAQRTQPVGTDDDADFVGGRDVVHYSLAVPASSGLTVEVALLYQPLSARWAAEIFSFDAPDISTFKRMYEAADRTPVVIDRARLEL